MRNRRAALEGLARILDAGAPEDLFGGGEDEAAFLYELLAETARARSSTYYWEICRTARRRGVTPDYVVDRAVVLLAAIKERRRTDLYRILGVPPLSGGELIRQRWLEVAKRHHPDTGGDAGRFRLAKQAYEVLRDPDRRAEYERFWVRALGPFERVGPEAGPALEPPSVAPTMSVDGNGSHPVAPEPAARVAPEPGARVVPEPAPRVVPEPTVRVPPLVSDAIGAAFAEAGRLFAARASLDRRIGAVADAGGPGISALLGRLEGALAPIPLEELHRLSDEVTGAVARLEELHGQLASLAALRRSLPDAR